MEVFIIAALTADGFIGRHDADRSTRWTSQEDAQFFQKMTKQAGVIICGRKTFATFGKPLPERLNVIYTSQPEKYSDQVNQFDRGAGEAVYTNLPPDQLLTKLKEQGFSQVAICGGASIYTLFLKSGLVTKIYLTVEPVLFGQGINLFNDELDQLQLQLVQIHHLSPQTKVFEYSVNQ